MKKTNSTPTAISAAVIILAASMGFSAYAQTIPAFPGAEGYGSVTRGGRDGKVIGKGSERKEVAH